MGTHPNSPSRISSSNKPLSEHLAAHPHLIGDTVLNRFDAAGGNLPFLFKVLSIEKALSIQTHPDKQTAELLHHTQPDIYTDPNHKPEMALALTPFRALCGFLPLPRIAAYLRSTPEFAALVPTTLRDAFLSVAASAASPDASEKAVLKHLFTALMQADQAQLEAQLSKLVARYQAGGAEEAEEPIASLVLRLNAQFPGDVGVFCPFMLNYIHLHPGEAIFLGAGEPHAYISGDCIECMANSDNVIRAGLTPKLRDIPNLLSGLTYSAAPPAKHAVTPAPFPSARPDAPNAVERASVLYDPPIAEFSVVQVQIPRDAMTAHRAVAGPSIVIVTEGKGHLRWAAGEAGDEASEGDVFFIGAGTALDIASAGDGPFVLYRAFVEVQ
jgi:mannose-6-phosphate isomerase